MLRLIRGELVKQIAFARGTAVATVRDQLKSIFRKTETARQLQLVQKILQLGAIV